MPGVIRGIGPVVERPAKAGDQLRFEFELLAGDDEIDQTLTIENPGASSLAPLLEITPLDASGDPMLDVFRVTNPGETDVPLRVVLIEYFSRG